MVEIGGELAPFEGIFAEAVNADGSVIVGRGWTHEGPFVWLWTAEGGARRLDVILAEQGAAMAGWRLDSAQDLSADGSVIVGNGVHNDVAGGFVAVVPSLTDTDGDGVRDEIDNCPADPNPLQSDCDQDGVGDECDSGNDYNANGVPDSCECIADIDGTGQVDGGDLAIVLAQWGTCPKVISCVADVDGDGLVEGKDLALVLSAWGACPVVVPSWATLVEAHPDPAVVFDENLRASILATGYPWRVRDTATQIEFVLIPPGTFQMGCSPPLQWGCAADQLPVHEVTLTHAFYLGRYEVTQAQWTAIMGTNPSLFQPANGYPGPDTRPVESVDWYALQDLLALIQMRLPSEAEWEYAYRAGTTTAYHGYLGVEQGTNDAALAVNMGWFSIMPSSQTHPVGQKLGNGFGLHDLVGNVWEWVGDWYSPSYYAVSPNTDPTGPGSGSARVIRGGGFLGDASGCFASYRYFSDPWSAGGIGFRVARNP